MSMSEIQSTKHITIANVHTFDFVPVNHMRKFWTLACLHTNSHLFMLQLKYGQYWKGSNLSALFQIC